MSSKSLQRFKHRVREITARSRGIAMDYRLGIPRSYVRGRMGHFGLASQLKLFDKLDRGFDVGFECVSGSVGVIGARVAGS